MNFFKWAALWKDVYLQPVEWLLIVFTSVGWGVVLGLYSYHVRRYSGKG